jgi:hypothetical protein
MYEENIHVDFPRRCSGITLDTGFSERFDQNYQNIIHVFRYKHTCRHLNCYQYLYPTGREVQLLFRTLE